MSNSLPNVGQPGDVVATQTCSNTFTCVSTKVFFPLEPALYCDIARILAHELVCRWLVDRWPLAEF